MKFEMNDKKLFAKKAQMAFFLFVFIYIIVDYDSSKCYNVDIDNIEYLMKKEACGMVKDKYKKSDKQLDPHIIENCLFKNISPDNIRQILNCSGAVIRSYRKDETIFCQGMQADYFYALLKGHVSIVSYMPSGRLNFLYDVLPGTLLGEHYDSQNDSGVRQYWYEGIASEASDVLAVPWRYLYSFCGKACDHHKQLIQNLYESMSSKEWLAMRKINVLGFASVQERVAAWLIQEAGESNTVPLQTTREEQAGYLCVARPSLSRTLMQMQKASMINVQRRQIQILDKEKLENVLQSKGL